MSGPLYKQKAITLIVVATVIRCIVALTTGLGNDEVYYRIYASSLQWNYFDHPPMVGWLIRLTTLNLWLDNDFFIRLGAIVAAAVASWFIFLAGKRIADAQTGFIAALLYNCCIYTSIIAGVFILPDSPQMICWTAGLYYLTGIATSKEINRKRSIDMLMFGLVTGLGMLCKIHSIFLWLGLILYIFLYNRRWLLKPVFYISGLLTIILFLPVIKWNIDNDFVTFFFHGSRVAISRPGLDIESLLAFAGGQIFYVNPVLFVLIVLAVLAALKNNLPVSVLQKRILLLTGLPLIVIALCISLFKPVLPHWSGPGYCSLILLTATYIRKRREHVQKRAMLIAVKAAGILLVVILSAGILLINFYPGTIAQTRGTEWGAGDFTLDMYGWSSIKKDIADICENDVSMGLMKPNSFFISNKWFPSAHIEHYLAGPLKKDFVAIGELYDIHQYAWLNNERRKLQTGDDAWCIVPSTNFFDPAAAYHLLFSKIELAGTIGQERAGRICRYFYVYRLIHYK